MDIALAYERQQPAQDAFDAYDLEFELVHCGPWEVASRASDPASTLMRDVTVRWNGRDYDYVFAVVFDAGTTTVADVSFGDMLP